MFLTNRKNIFSIFHLIVQLYDLFLEFPYNINLLLSIIVIFCTLHYDNHNLLYI